MDFSRGARNTILLVSLAAFAQPVRYNYPIPDPLVLLNGDRVKSARTWADIRRPELIRIFEDQIYGRAPSQLPQTRNGELVTELKALGGKAVRKQLTVYFSPLLGGPQMHILLYLPARAKGPVSVFVGLNFDGNHTVHADTGVLMNDVWIKDPAGSGKMLLLPPDDRTRGSAAASWQVEKIVGRGYGIATVCYNDFEPDFYGGAARGVRSLFPEESQQWSAMGAWAWGISRVVDHLMTDSRIDPKRIVVLGHSRLGKAALWAAAQDSRIGMAISNESGKGGASLLKRGYGETAEHLNAAFPQWFCANYKQYVGHPENLPVDGNELLALIAPRPLYVASAEGDQNSDPRGEFMSAADAGRVYELFGRKGLGTNQMAPVNAPIMHDIGYHIRTGKHDLTEFDWDQFLAFADMHWGAAK